MIRAVIGAYTNVESVFSDVFCRHSCSVTCCLVTKLDVLQNFSFRLGAMRGNKLDTVSWCQRRPIYRIQLFHVGQENFCSCPKLSELEFCVLRANLADLGFERNCQYPHMEKLVNVLL